MGYRHVFRERNFGSIDAKGTLASRGSPFAGVKEEIGSKLNATAGGFFLLPWVAASAGDKATPAAAHSATTAIPVNPRIFGKPELPLFRVDIVWPT